MTQAVRRPSGRSGQDARAARRRVERKTPPPSRAPVFIAGGVVVAVVAVIAVVALVFGSGGGGKSTPAGIEQTRAVTVTGAAVPQFRDSGVDPGVGAAVPTVTGQSFDGTPVEIRPGHGAMVVIAVAHWCPHCQAEVPRLTSWIRANQLPAGVELVALSTSVQKNLDNYPPSAWLERESFPVRTMADDDRDTAAAALGVTSFPYFMAVSADGKVVERGSGEIDEARMIALMQRALGTPASGTPASGTPASGTPASGTPASGT